MVPSHNTTRRTFLGSISVGGVVALSLCVQGPSGPAELELEEYNAELDLSRNIVIKAQVTNNGGETGTETLVGEAVVETYDGDETLTDSRQITVEGGETETFDLKITTRTEHDPRNADVDVWLE